MQGVYLPASFSPTLPWGLATLSRPMQAAEALYRLGWNKETKVYLVDHGIHDEIDLQIVER